MNTTTNPTRAGLRALWRTWWRKFLRRKARPASSIYPLR